MCGNLTASDQILADLALTSINEKYKIGNGNLNLKVTLNERNSSKFLNTVTCRSQCVFLFLALKEGQINVICSGIPKVLGNSRKVQSNQEHKLFSGDPQCPNISATLI